MRDRNITWFIIIIVLTLVTLWVNLPLKHPQWVNDLLVWQPEESKKYNRDTGADPLRIRQGLDLQGGIQILLQAMPVESETTEDKELAAGKN